MQEKSNEQQKEQKRGYNLLDKEEEKSMLSCFTSMLSCFAFIFESVFKVPGLIITKREIVHNMIFLQKSIL